MDLTMYYVEREGRIEKAGDGPFEGEEAFSI
jgi:hypothetical protein